MKTKQRDLVDEFFDQLDLVDELEPDTKDEVLYSKELTNKIREEISKIPIGKIITKILQKETEKVLKGSDDLKESVASDLKDTKSDLKKDIHSMKKEMDDFMEKMRVKYDHLKNEFLNQPQYQFGGFSPQINDLNIGDPGTNGSWRIVISGTDLQMQRRESGVWTLKGSFTP